MKLTKVIRYGAWAAVAALAFGVGVVSYTSWDNQESVALAPVAKIGGSFSLINGDGNEFTDKDLGNKPSLVFFGFTYCPDVCPTTLSEMQGWIEELGPDADKVNFIFISVDPERDSPEVMKDYVFAFDQRIIPLTGSMEQIADVAKKYRVYYRKVPLDGGDYTMDHTAAVYMMNNKLEFTGTISYGEAQETALPKVRELITKGSV